jgi:hypothetical protein
MKYLLMQDGFVLDQVITDNIIAAAKRGKITPKGQEMLLIPDTRKKGLFPSVKQKDCLKLRNLTLK